MLTNSLERGVVVSDFSEDIEQVDATNFLSEGANNGLREYLNGQDYGYLCFPERERQYGRRRAMLFLTDNGVPSPLGNAYYGREPIIFITRAYLEMLARHDPREIMSLRRADDELIFVGYPFDCLFLDGIEEVHHHLFPELEREQRYPQGLSVAEYDSSQVELEALKFRLRVAKHMKFPKATIEIFEGRVRNAEEIRRRKGKRL